MLTLGIETSESPGSLALLSDDQILGEWPLAQPGRRHAQTLVGELDRRLDEYHLTPQQIDALAVSLGPGSFTGLRVGVMCAKTWAYVTGCRLVGIDTYLAIACNAPNDVDHIFVVGDALRGDLYVGEYSKGSNRNWQRIGEVSIRSKSEWIEQRRPGDVVTGPASAQFGSEFQQQGLIVLEDSTAQPRASFIARLGYSQLSSGQSDSWQNLVPFYLRRPAAEEKNAFRTPFA